MIILKGGVIFIFISLSGNYIHLLMYAGGIVLLWSVCDKLYCSTEPVSIYQGNALIYNILLIIPILLLLIILIFWYQKQKKKFNSHTEKLKESESRLREAQKLAHLGNWYWDVKTGKVEWSDEVYNIFRLDPRTFTPQIDSILELSPWPEDHERDKEILARVSKTHEVGSYEQRFLRPDGSIGYYFSTFQGIYDDNDNIIAMKGTVQDITERKQAEVEKARLEEQYHQIQKVESIGRLAGGVAHDLNNLLSPIIGYGEMLQEELKPEDRRRQSVDEILKAAFRARDLVSQLLAFSRKQTLEYNPVDLNKTIAGFENLLRRTIREDIAIEIIPSPETCTVMADIGQIEQVIMNLSVNAQDAMPDSGKLTIEISKMDLDEEYAARHQDVHPGEYIMLSVSDTGSGMDDETREHVFDPFFTTKGDQGIGLGLSTVYGIVKQHGGNIWVYSEPGMGTTIKVYLPVSDEEYVDEQTEKVKEIKLGGSETILLVEDNEQVRNLAFSILKKHGYAVLTAGNGTEALRILNEHVKPPDLLLTDVVMPEMNGKALFTEASKKQPSLKVLYMSGYTDNVIAHHGVLEKGITLLHKPFTIESLTEKVRGVLDED